MDDKRNSVRRRLVRKLTEEETDSIAVHLTTRRGLRLLVPWFIGAVIIVIGMSELPWGAMTFALGIAIIIYGTYRFYRHEESPAEPEMRSAPRESATITIVSFTAGSLI